MHYKLLFIIPKDIFDKGDPSDVREYVNDIMSVYSRYNNPDIGISGYDLNKIYEQCVAGNIKTFEEFCKRLGINSRPDPNIFPIHDNYHVYTDDLIYEIAGRSITLAPENNDTEDYIEEITKKPTVWDNVLWVLSFGNYNYRTSNIKKKRAKYADLIHDRLEIGKNIMNVDDFREGFFWNAHPPIIDRDGKLHIHTENGEWKYAKYCLEGDFNKVLDDSLEDYIIVIDCHC